MWRLFLIAVLAASFISCEPKHDSVRDFSDAEVTMPDGSTVVVERVTDTLELARGLMFRDALPAGRGMLFVWGKPGKYAAWMYQVKIPLDIIWMDLSHTVVEVASATPCPSKSARECPHFGGQQNAQYMLEIGAGMAAKHGVQVGSKLSF
jgi:uncharacterized protein